MTRVRRSWPSSSDAFLVVRLGRRSARAHIRRRNRHAGQGCSLTISAAVRNLLAAAAGGDGRRDFAQQEGFEMKNRMNC